MDPNLHSSLSYSVDTKTAFRRPSNDATNRKYRRRSPVGGSSSSDGSPKHGRSRSPIYSREDHAEVSEPHQRRKDDERVLDRDSGRSQYGRRDDLYRHSDRHSSRSSHSHFKRDEYSRHDKNVADEDRNYQRSFSHSGHESRGGHHSDHTRQESEHNRLRDYLDRYPRDKYDGSEHRGKYKVKEASSLEHQKYKDKNPSFDRAGSGRRHANSKSEDTEKDWHTQDRDGRDEKKDYNKSSCDRRSDRIHSRDESRGHRYDSTSRRDDSRHQLKEAYKSDQELDCQKFAKDEKRKYDDWETKKEKDQYNKVPGGRYEDKIAFTSENKNSPPKKPKSSSSNKFTNNGNDADEKQSSSSNPAQETGGKLLVGQSHSNDSMVANNLDAAKVAAMKAAELVNRNLVGVGYMTADQKKKLLWGSKKSTTAEESGHRWDNVVLGDRERQEKFNKLMGVKGDVKMDKPDNQDQSGLLQAEKQKELQLDLEKQYTAGLRRRDGRTVGLGL